MTPLWTACVLGKDDQRATIHFLRTTFLYLTSLLVPKRVNMPANNTKKYLESLTRDEMKKIWRSVDCVCFDVDSTVVQEEGIDELADFCGVGEAVKQW